MFQNKHWIFQQDSAPTYKAKTSQQWVANHVPEFISTDFWPAARPYLKPLDYKMWLFLEGMVCERHNPNLESLK